ncbi:MAG TPA: hypothetical protein VI874_01650 [Candidatus Norongarragalinales archaeon]|nr:hypothetical protein [Candidatus Norongarragalinales archaeon]
MEESALRKTLKDLVLLAETHLKPFYRRFESGKYRDVETLISDFKTYFGHLPGVVRRAGKKYRVERLCADQSIGRAQRLLLSQQIMDPSRLYEKQADQIGQLGHHHEALSLYGRAQSWNPYRLGVRIKRLGPQSYLLLQKLLGNA